MKATKINEKISLSSLLTGTVIAIVLTVLVFVLLFFIKLYEDSMELNSITSSEQAVVQVMNTLENYTNDMAEIMKMISDNIGQERDGRDNFFRNFMNIRSDVVSLTVYNNDGQLLNCWSDGLELKEEPRQNLSYSEIKNDKELNISKPHVESLFTESYPWVVTISQRMKDSGGENIQVFMDIRFSNIANYVDDVGIGQHGYCFILDTDGNIIYHPQQQLIYSRLKEEKTEELKALEDGAYIRSNVIYTIYTLENCDWRVVGVSYVDEMITDKVKNMIRVCAILLFLVLITALSTGLLFSRFFSTPANRLAKAMGDFEKEAENFRFAQVKGTSEIISLSKSFGHMVLRIQRLMEKVREEEISLRKTELKALQAQINPHFLYNTLDSITWMCEEERTEEAIEMVNALARLFRISISKGNELIPLEKELQHAQSYLKIQNFRYKNQFIYSFDVDEACLNYLCNKITLQPIIENAIYHGLNGMVDTGKIDISIHQADEDIFLTVKDNGVGMTAEQCIEILHKESGDRTGIGIKNVNDRIKIYFGAKYGLSITSELDVGTCVEIRIPKIREDDNEIK